MNKLIINSDDFGYSRGVNHAILDAHQEGILTSASLLTNTPGFQQAVKLAKENPTLGVGVHLVLTFLKPLREDVPSLVDEQGNFYRPDAHRTGLVIVEVAELYKEWDTQIQTVLNAALQPTHLDSHHHAHTFNEYYTAVFLSLAEKYQLAVRGNLVEKHNRPTTAYFEPAFDGISLLEANEQEEYLELLLATIKERPSTEVMCHLGYMDAFLAATSAYTDLRLPQVELLIHSEFVEKVRKEAAVQLINFSEL